MLRTDHRVWHAYVQKHLLSLLAEPGTVPDSGGTESIKKQYIASSTSP